MSDEVVLAIISAVSAAFMLAMRLQSGHINRMQSQIDLLIELCIDEGNTPKD